MKSPNDDAEPPTASPQESPLRLAVWAAADKALPVLYGLAIILIAMKALSKDEWGAWTIFSVVFMVISMCGDFFVLQPMVKIASEDAADTEPTITAGLALYTILSLALGLGVVALAEPLATVVKTPEAIPSFRLTFWIVVANLTRSHAIRVLQISYRIVAIFVVDLVYFVGLIALMCYGWAAGSFVRSTDLVMYNILAFIASSLVGLWLAMRGMRPAITGVPAAARRLARLGVHQGGTGLLTVLQQQSDVLIVGGMRGGKAAGVYGAARTFYRFFDSVRDAAQLLLVPATSRAYSQERIEAVEEITELATAALVILMFPLTVIMIALAPIVIPIILPNFPEAIDEFQWLMANGFLAPFVIVPSAVLLGIGHTRDLFRGTFIGTVMLIAAGGALTWFFGSVGMAAGVFVGTGVTGILLTRRMNRYVPFTFRSVLRRARTFGPALRNRVEAFSKGMRRNTKNS